MATGVGQAAQASARVASQYDKLESQTAAERQASRIYFLRAFNNWIKASLIVTSVPADCSSVLDLACGKLGDMGKWRQQGVKLYTGIDISMQQLQEAAERFNSATQRIKRGLQQARAAGQEARMQEQRKQLFQLRLLQADLGVVDLDSMGVLSDRFTSAGCADKDREVFNVVSMQFALHYLFATEARAVQFFRFLGARTKRNGVFMGTIPDANVLVRRLRGLKPGETSFGNSIFRVTAPQSSLDRLNALGMNPFGLKYTFWLDAQVESIDEYLVPWPLLVRLARMAGFRPVLRHNFHAFYETLMHSRAKSSAAAKKLLTKMIQGKDDATGQTGLSSDEWEAAGMYMVFAFRKVGPVAPELPIAPRPAPPAEVEIPENIRDRVEAEAACGFDKAASFAELPKVPVPRSGRELFSWPAGQDRHSIPYADHVEPSSIMDASRACLDAWRSVLAARSQAVELGLADEAGSDTEQPGHGQGSEEEASEAAAIAAAAAVSSGAASGGRKRSKGKSGSGTGATEAEMAEAEAVLAELQGGEGLGDDEEDEVGAYAAMVQAGEEEEDDFDLG